MGLFSIRSRLSRRRSAPDDRRDASLGPKPLVVKPEWDTTHAARALLESATISHSPPEPCRYVVTKERLGRGAYGLVLGGLRVAAPGEAIAVKVIADGRMKVAALEKEVALLQRLSDAHHPSLPHFHGRCTPAEVRAGAARADCNESELPLSQPLGECHLLAMDLCRGGELFERVLSVGGLSERVSAPLAAQLCEAVRAAHALGIAHRDIKLENVLFVGKHGEPDGDNVVLIDWGLAHQHAVRGDGSIVEEVLRSRCGSRSYMAPEVADRRKPGYDGFCADVWSLGVCLFAMNVGFFPFEQADPSSDWRARKVLEAQKHGRSAMETICGFYPKRQLRLTKPLCALIDRMLVFDPAHRATLDEVLHSAWLSPHVVESAVDAMDICHDIEPPELSASRSPADSVASTATAECSPVSSSSPADSVEVGSVTLDLQTAAEAAAAAYAAAATKRAAARKLPPSATAAAEPASPLVRCRTWDGHSPDSRDLARGSDVDARAEARPAAPRPAAAAHAASTHGAAAAAGAAAAGAAAAVAAAAVADAARAAAAGGAAAAPPTSPTGLSRVAAKLLQQAPAPQWIAMERQDSESTASSATSASSSVYRSMARLQRLEEAQSSHRRRQPSCHYAVAGATRPPLPARPQPPAQQLRSTQHTQQRAQQQRAHPGRPHRQSPTMHRAPPLPQQSQPPQQPQPPQPPAKPQPRQQPAVCAHHAYTAAQSQAKPAGAVAFSAAGGSKKNLKKAGGLLGSWY